MTGLFDVLSSISEVYTQIESELGRSDKQKNASNEKTPARYERGLEDSSFNFDQQYVEYELYFIILSRVDNFRLWATSTESAEVFRDIEEVEIAVAVDVCSSIIRVERAEEC